MRCHGRGDMYLASKEDSRGICLRSGRRAAANAVWTVRPEAGADGEAAVIFRGAYGLFLASSEIPATTGPPDAVAAEQRALAVHAAPPLDMLWQGIWKKYRMLIKNYTRSGNGKYLKCRSEVTFADDNASSMLH
ncbi:hypothetical protein QOZ80_7BG0603990 [Eleusine coracana subsp. coracana]|nr:hypothetical protein QOZ80_7BG0603990 [Eleusine coracana subsp. coracana]